MNRCRVVQSTVTICPVEELVPLLSFVCRGGRENIYKSPYIWFLQCNLLPQYKGVAYVCAYKLFIFLLRKLRMAYRKKNTNKKSNKLPPTAYDNN